jgi:hypothetical protein
MPSPIDVALAKIERAETHLDELQKECAAFFGDGPYDIPGDYDPKTKRFTFYFVANDPPPIMDILVGQIAHSLRSALNNLVSGLSGAPSGETDFPIFKSEPDFRERGGADRVKRLSDAQQATIEAFQPYQRPDPCQAPLAMLNRLAREDKHRSGTFRVAAFIGASMEFKAIRDIKGYGHVNLYGGRLENGDPLAEVEVIVSGPKPELHINCEFTGGVAFSQGSDGWVLPAPFPAIFEEVRTVVAALS